VGEGGETGECPGNAAGLTVDKTRGVRLYCRIGGIGEERERVWGGMCNFVEILVKEFPEKVLIKMRKWFRVL
jgi:hypothetical protein